MTFFKRFYCAHFHNQWHSEVGKKRASTLNKRLFIQYAQILKRKNIGACSL